MAFVANRPFTTNFLSYFKVMEDDQEIGAYMFRRTVPALHLTPDDVRWMVYSWISKLIYCFIIPLFVLLNLISENALSVTGGNVQWRRDH